MTTLLQVFSKHVVEVLADLMRERLQDEHCALPFRNVHQSVSRTGSLAGRYIPYLENYVKR